MTRLAPAALLVLLAATVASEARAFAPPCRVAQLRAGLGPLVSEATGQHTLAVRLVDAGPACALDGYPLVWVEDARGTIPFLLRHGGDQMVNARPPRRFVVRAGGTAWLVLDHYRCDRGGVRGGRSVRIAPPGGSRAASLVVAARPGRADLDWCGAGDPGSVLTVSPFVPTLAAALGGSAAHP